MVEVGTLTPALEEAYETAVCSTDAGLLSYSLKYRRFLERILEDTRSEYLIARDGDRVLAVFPIFIKFNHKIGNVVNSLPFYGSNGGPLLAGGVAPDATILRELAAAFHALAIRERAAVSTLISNPLTPPEVDLGVHFRHSMIEERIGQLTQLPPSRSGEPVGEKLMGLFHSKTRNMVRKGLSNVKVTESDSEEDLRLLASLHRDNISALGGVAKPWGVFAAIREIFEYGKDYRLFVASLEGQKIATLLVLYYNKTAEYFVPATDHVYRSRQPMSALIFHAMQEAVHRGCRWWNWGGTWLTQSGVYQFKSRWGSEDHIYRYYISEGENGERIRQLDRNTVLREYPFFFVVPFSLLSTNPPDHEPLK